MTIILDKFAHISNTVKIYSDSMYICAWGNFAHVSTMLPLYMAELSEVVATLVIHIINQIIILNIYILYVRLKYNYIEYQPFKNGCIFDSHLYSNKIKLIKSDPFKNITKLYRL